MKTETIYLVVGTTGEYSCQTEWFVRAYRNKKRAEKHAEDAKRRGMELAEWRNERGEKWEYSPSDARPFNEFDPQFELDYTGTDYYVCDITLEG